MWDFLVICPFQERKNLPCTSQSKFKVEIEANKTLNVRTSLSIPRLMSNVICPTTTILLLLPDVTCTPVHGSILSVEYDFSGHLEVHAFQSMDIFLLLIMV